MHLQHVGGPAAREPVDEHCLPQWARSVEGTHREVRGEGHQVGTVTAAVTPAVWQAGAPQVVVEREVLIHRPRRKPNGHQWFHDPLATARDGRRGPAVGLDESLPVGRAVEDHDGGDGRRLCRRSLAAPHQRFDLVHPWCGRPVGDPGWSAHRVRMSSAEKLSLSTICWAARRAMAPNIASPRSVLTTPSETGMVRIRPYSAWAWYSRQHCSRS